MSSTDETATPPTAPKTQQEDEDRPEALNENAAAAEDENDDEDNNDGEDDSKNKKKKNKKKKKKTKSAAKKAALANSIWAMSDEDFFAMCDKWLEETKSQVDGIDEETRLATPDFFNGYAFSGSLRPALITEQMKSEDHIEKPDYADSGTSELETRVKMGPEAGTIPVAPAEDIEKMREVCQIGREVLDISSRFMRAGVTGDEIDRVVYKACMERGVYPSPLNYYHFKKSVCVSPNEVICHGIPDCRPIQEGDIVNLDISVYKDGFHADLNETFLIGKCDQESIDLLRTSYECLKLASELIRPGNLYREVGAVISKHAAQNGCSVVRKYCGHGVGRLFHGPPNVPHYAKNKARGIMRPGHIFTIEPMINQGGNWGDLLWPDDWTATTKDGKRSSQYEHTFLVTEDGFEVLTARAGAPKNAMPEWDEKTWQR